MLAMRPAFEHSRRVDRIDTHVLRRVSWIFLALGLIGLSLFALDPDIHERPQLLLIGGVGVLGSIKLRVLAFVFREPPHHDC